MTQLRLQESLESSKHEGEVFACCYSPDGSFVLSAGWDGHLRLWEVTSGVHLSALKVCLKPLSSCAVSPDGRRWVAGTMEGLVTFWDAQTHLVQSQHATHTRPVAGLHFAPGGEFLASASWDRHVSLHSLRNERDNRTFLAHADIVAGCRFSPDGGRLLTWSYDRTLRLWDLTAATEPATLSGHADRVLAADIAPDGGMAASGSRDGELVLWDLESRQKLNAVDKAGELRACLFGLDGATLLTADAAGVVTSYALPDLEPLAHLPTGHKAMCATLSPRGDQLALGGEDGLVRFVSLEGDASRPLVVTASRSTRQTSSRLQKFFGQSTTTTHYASVCPACRHAVEHLGQLPASPAPCPSCRRPLRFSRKTVAAAHV